LRCCKKNIVAEKWKFAKKWNVKSNLLRSVPFFQATKQTIYHFVDQRFGYVCVLFVCVRVCVSYCAFFGRLESRSVCLPKSPEFFEVTSSCTSRNWPMVSLRIDIFKRWVEHTVDGSEIRHPPVEVGSLSHYLQGFTHPRWCRISSINSMCVFVCFLVPQSFLKRWVFFKAFLGGGFLMTFLDLSRRNLGKWSILRNIFQMGG